RAGPGGASSGAARAGLSCRRARPHQRGLLRFSKARARPRHQQHRSLHAARAGTRILVVDPRADYGAAGEWSASAGNAALARELYPVRSGGDIAFINGVLKTLIANEQLDRAFIDRHTAAFGALKESLAGQSWEMLEERSGLTRADMQRFAAFYGQARAAVLVYG